MDELAAGPAPGRRREVQEVLSRCSALVTERTGDLRARLAGARALQDALDDLLLG